MISEKNRFLLFRTGLLSTLFILFYTWLLPFYDVSDLSLGIYSLDIRSSYTKDIVIQLFNSIGEPGIVQYRKFLLVDFVYILIYGSLSFFILKLLLNHMGRLANKLKFTIWTPTILIILDIIENINTFFLLNDTTEIAENAVQFGSVVTSLKWIVASVVFGMIICYAFYAILRYVFRKLRKYESTSSK